MEKVSCKDCKYYVNKDSGSWCNADGQFNPQSKQNRKCDCLWFMQKNVPNYRLLIALFTLTVIVYTLITNY